MTSPADLWAAARAEVERKVEVRKTLNAIWPLTVWRGYLGVLDRHRPNRIDRGCDGNHDDCDTPDWTECPEVAAVLDSLRATGWQG